VIADQIERLMKRIVDTWPDGRWPAGTVTEWKKDLARLDHDDAELARLTLKDSWEHTTPPTFGLFLSTYQAHARRRAILRETERPAEEWNGPTDGARREIAAIRDRHGWTRPAEL
jgi:hypothetical protein